MCSTQPSIPPVERKLNDLSVCSMPKTSIISYRTASFSSILPLPLDATSTEMILHLTMCLLHELRLGPESKWYGYLQMLPRQVVLIPSLWGEHDLAGEDGRAGLEWLKGTEVEQALMRKDKEGLSVVSLFAFLHAIG